MGYSQRLRRAAYDTSALLLLYEGVRVFEDVEDSLDARPECIVPRQVVEELERHAASRRLHLRRAARLALEAIRSRGCRVVEAPGGSADEALLWLALHDPELIVVTADNELRRRLREHGLPNVYYRASRRGFALEA
ncbi:MAG: 30S processome protein Utp24 [Crenarchaeota archaeon]|nr:30S processome protein Utp24 [Thermoproteota archaeon]